MAHVTTTHFLPGVEVGLYPRRPMVEGGASPLQTLMVPDSGQVTFEVPEPGLRYWLAGIGSDGKLRCVQSHSKPGEPVDVRAVLALTRPEEPPDLAERRVVGARGTAHRRGRKRK